MKITIRSGRESTIMEEVEEIVNAEPIKDIESSAAALYDGGWRAEDRDDLIAEYRLTTEDADKLCRELLRLENINE